MANKQPFYNECNLIFTTTEEMDEAKLATALKAGLKAQGVKLVDDSIEIDDFESEPGDPADLL